MLVFGFYVPSKARRYSETLIEKNEGPKHDSLQIPLTFPFVSYQDFS
jgi:hypothetical protein